MIVEERPIPTSGSRQTEASRPRSANQAARLSGTGAFEAIFRRGARREGRYVQIVAAPASQSPGRVGFVVSRKVLPRSVDRNRLKRLLREFLRRSPREVGAFDLVIRLKRPVAREALPAVASEAGVLIGEAVGIASAKAYER